MFRYPHTYHCIPVAHSTQNDNMLQACSPVVEGAVAHSLGMEGAVSHSPGVEGAVTHSPGMEGAVPHSPGVEGVVPPRCMYMQLSHTASGPRACVAEAP